MALVLQSGILMRINLIVIYLLFFLFSISCSDNRKYYIKNNRELNNKSKNIEKSKENCQKDNFQGSFEKYVREKIVEWVLEKEKTPKIKTVLVKDKKFNVDCSNFVRAAYYNATDNDLFEEATRLGIYEKIKKDDMFSRSNFGALLLYVLFKLKYKIVDKPSIGDIIFFDRTYDKNKNNTLKDDVLTHVGIVVSIDDDGTIEFIHAGTSKGIEKSFLNLNYKDSFVVNGKTVNSYIQRVYSWHRKSETAASLVRGFGSIF
ncbi:MAG TPA: CHAP domain-containing protein [Spirochaetota bacterium]|nr:CHAP domain-containing protein [Spirochaetota bacterium]HOM38469.1 CHAP domain-containing protein [Spirochaetota bacterium]HPQ49009.1 CHAP domain-containing protein [Spirochaetota bacterium]